MAKYYNYEVDYSCVCEACGREIRGVIKRGPLEYNGGILPSSLANAADAADMVLSKSIIKRAVDGDGVQPYTATNADKCPYCGVRQSWKPLPEPKKSMGIGCLFFLGILGACVGLLAWAIFFLDYDALGPVLLCTGLALGIFLAVCYNRKHKAEEERIYQEHKKEYDAFMDSMKNRTVRNKPIIYWETARRNPID